MGEVYCSFCGYLAHPSSKCLEQTSGEKLGQKKGPHCTGCGGLDCKKQHLSPQVTKVPQQSFVPEREPWQLGPSF